MNTNGALLDAAARLLLDIAGPALHHIEMSRSGPKKYYSVARALTEADARAHLRGVKTKGALCSHPDGRGRALAYDADGPERWQVLRQAAQQLAAAGYRPLLEPSPRGRGGHLWIIYTALMDASEARSHAHTIAPELETIGEYWPGPPQGQGWNRVRLPGGRYVAPGFSAWCKLYDAQGQELARDGMSAARVLLDMQTPAAMIPALPPDHVRSRDPELAVTTPPPGRDRDADPTVTGPAPAARRDTQIPVTPHSNDPTQPQDPEQSSTPDPNQAAKRYTAPLRNGPAQTNRFLWFSYTPSQLAAWFNERHRLEELHPPERGAGMAFSPSVQERTPSTAYKDTPEGERWTDFSSQAPRADGHPDGGDALELYIRLQGRSRRAVFSELGREMIGEARVALEAAARNGAEPPLWIAEITTPAGWQYYERIRRR